MAFDHQSSFARLTVIIRPDAHERAEARELRQLIFTALQSRQR
jgi:hypothetical protein